MRAFVVVVLAACFASTCAKEDGTRALLLPAADASAVALASPLTIPTDGLREWVHSKWELLFPTPSCLDLTEADFDPVEEPAEQPAEAAPEAVEAPPAEAVEVRQEQRVVCCCCCCCYY